LLFKKIAPKVLLNSIHIYCSKLSKKIELFKIENSMFTGQGSLWKNEKRAKTEQNY
jgi:hypothetical protein